MAMMLRNNIPYCCNDTYDKERKIDARLNTNESDIAFIKGNLSSYDGITNTLQDATNNLKLDIENLRTEINEYMCNTQQHRRIKTIKVRF